MRTVGVAALTAVVVSVLAYLLLPPWGAPPETLGTDADVVGRLDALEQAASRRPPEPPRLEGNAEAAAARMRAAETRIAKLEGEVAAARKAAARSAAARAPSTLVHVESKPADAEVQKWVERLKDPSENVAFSATLELGRLKSERAVQPLVEVLREHRDYYVRLGAATALGDIRAPDAVPALIDAMADKDALVVVASNEALEKITSTTVELRTGASARQVRDAQDTWRKWFDDNSARLFAERDR